MSDGSLLPLKGNTEENGEETMETDGGDMKNWMSSVQQRNSDSNNVDPDKKSNTVPELKPRSEEQGEDLSKNPMEFCNKKSKGGAFVPFKEHTLLYMHNRIKSSFRQSHITDTRTNTTSSRILGNKGGVGRLSFIEDLLRHFNSLEAHKVRPFQQQTTPRQLPSQPEEAIEETQELKEVEREGTQASDVVLTKLSKKMRKSASLLSLFSHFEEEFIVETRRPATVREGKGSNPPYCRFRINTPQFMITPSERF
ncbi:hypothetical protein F3Y22_tig00111721pilonHSYRG00123 [Hibiscus syriacus]|uniref:Uncharacterized protein n=1 Tax=Hibiscus syriacus TaxID=106335 RepID=A0A6A2XGT9_HIBSY|nr:hypothetical protein F3Y22_tig00111721pilonHSYRG00123 [Hibiscus syriacus]